MLVSEQQLQEIRRLLYDGVPKTRVARKFGICTSTLNKYLSLSTSIQEQEEETVFEQQMQKIHSLLDLGVPKTSIAKKCGISVRTLYRYLNASKAKNDTKSVSTNSKPSFQTVASARTDKEKREERRRQLDKLLSDEFAALQPPSND